MESIPELDRTDRRILECLQEDGRLTHAELGRRVHLSAPAVARRMERLEREGVIAGYRAVVDPARAGFPVEALVRFRSHPGRMGEALAWVEAAPRVRECLRVTGADCFLVRFALRTVAELQETTDQLGRWGTTETSLVLSAPVPWRAVPAQP
jgi:Lrp/AsnC family leucine-responsive transcriptional regulator